MNIDDLEGMVLVEVDVQNDFILKDGGLPVMGADCAVRAAIMKTHGWARECGIPIIATMDCHAPDEPEFKSFPPHCVEGTAGYDRWDSSGSKKDVFVVPLREIPEEDILDALAYCPMIQIQKNTIDLFSNPNAKKLFEGVKKAIVTGVATDYCVKAVVLGLRNLGVEVIVIKEAIAGVDLDASAAAVDEMVSAGAQFVLTDDIVGQK